MIITALLLLASAPTQSVACTKLQADFDRNERGWALQHDIYKRMLDVSQPDLPRYAVGSWDQAHADLEKQDQSYAADSDRIVTLLIANKCKAPDHVATWYVYSDTNPTNKP
jgi:hypothetical protein